MDYSYFGKFQGLDVRNKVLDLLDEVKACFASARKQIFSVKENQQFPLNYSPEEIMQMNLWERETRQVEKEIMEMESLLLNYWNSFSFYPKGMRQWLQSLQERSCEILPLIQRQ